MKRYDDLDRNDIAGAAEVYRNMWLAGERPPIQVLLMLQDTESSQDELVEMLEKIDEEPEVAAAIERFKKQRPHGIWW